MRALALSLLTLASAAPVQAASWQGNLDLRTLPANTRPSAIAVAVDAREAAARGFTPVISIAVNGIVVAHLPASRTDLTRLSMPLQDRLLSVRNMVEVAASLPDCEAGPCAEALATARPAGPARLSLSSPEAAATDFSQLVTRFRAGVTVHADGADAGRLADLFLREIAPAAPRGTNGPAHLYIDAEPPAGLHPLIRFDLGPVRLMRSDGPEILSAEQLDARTTVQVLRFGAEPVVWIRPGTGPLPRSMTLDAGDVAIFDERGRDIAFSTARDRAVDITYGEGVDPSGGHRRTLIFRLGLLLLWLVASLFLFRFFRKLPRPQRSDAAA